MDMGLVLGHELRSSLLTLTTSTSNATRPSECEHSWLSLLTRFGKVSELPLEVSRPFVG